jgi:hypothetical protein
MGCCYQCGEGEAPYANSFSSPKGRYGSEDAGVGFVPQAGFGSYPTIDDAPFRFRNLKIAGEDGKKDDAWLLDTTAPWLIEKNRKERTNILQIGGAYFRLATAGVSEKDKPKTEQYSGMHLVYGDTLGYTKPFREEFQRFVGADIDEDSKKRYDGTIDGEDANKRAMKSGAHEMAMQAAVMAAAAGRN